ncbi:MAG: NAD(P)H:quinone oxidoreductase [Thermoplasmatota archaeon]
MNILVVFYSMYGHTYKMAKAVVEGAKKVENAEVEIMRVKETVPDEILEEIGAKDAQKQFDDVPICETDDLKDRDAIIFGTPTRYGNMAGQMRNFLDKTGELWGEGELIGVVGSVFTSTATQHGGQETTIQSFHTTLLHHGMILVGLPYSFEGLSVTDEMSGGSPYGASTIAGMDGERMPSENELKGARYQGEHVAKITKQIVD